MLCYTQHGALKQFINCPPFAYAFSLFEFSLNPFLLLEKKEVATDQKFNKENSLFYLVHLLAFLMCPAAWTEQAAFRIWEISILLLPHQLTAFLPYLQLWNKKQILSQKNAETMHLNYSGKVILQWVLFFPKTIEDASWWRCSNWDPDWLPLLWLSSGRTHQPQEPTCISTEPLYITCIKLKADLHST